MKDPLPARPTAEALAERYEPDETTWSVLRSIARRGPWEPPETMRVVSVLGHVVLDYGEAALPAGVTVLDCEVFLGSAEILVPTGVELELTGSVLLGSVETGDERGWSGGPERHATESGERPILSLRCSGVMGSVEVKFV